MKISFLSVCSGIESASVAWNPLGWQAVAYSEIDPFCCSVLAHHYPEIPNFGDFREIGGDDAGAVDVLVAGTPCQDFSISGPRTGMDGSRGLLAGEFIRLVGRICPRWVVYENVPGLLSVRLGRDFGTFLGSLGQLGYGFAYRVLDARYFGVPQQRRRVLVVAHLGDWRRAAAVLFERQSLLGNYPPVEKEEEEYPSSLGGSVAESHPPQSPVYRSPFVYGGNNRSGSIEVSPCLNAHMRRRDFSSEAFIVCANGVRRFTPLEAERLQGFPDKYTQVPHMKRKATDAPRFRALGNSMAVPVMKWIGQRIEMVEKIEGKIA